MGDESRWDDHHSQDWGDRYRKPERDEREQRAAQDERRYGAGDYEGSRYGRYDQSRYDSQAVWPGYEPGPDGPIYNDRGGEGRGWERVASRPGHDAERAEGYDRSRRDFAGWDAPFGGHPAHRSDQGGDGWDRMRQEGRSFLDRTREEIASLFGAGRRDGQRADTDRPRQEGGFRGVGPRGYRRSDERIREDVYDRLTEDSWLDAANVEISIQDGEVTLNGTVRSRADKRRAEDLVEQVSGVGHVQNNLRVDSDRSDSPPTPTLI